MIIATFQSVAEALRSFGEAFSAVWFIALPIGLFLLFKSLWMRYALIMNLTQTPFVVLEIIPPRDLEKSPKIMESFYSGFAGTDKTPNALEIYCDGYFNPWISLELVGKEGAVHFYIRTPKNVRSLVEAHIYAQYPDTEIVEASDYIDDVPKILPNKEWDLWGTDFELANKDAYPVKTYRYFEEDITGKMIDPLAAIVESMGKLGQGQYIWFQLVIQSLPPRWRQEGLEVVKELAGRTKKPESVFAHFFADVSDIFGNITKGLFSPVEFATPSEKKEEQPLEFRLTPIERKVLEAVEGNIGKDVFRTKMRFIYLGRREGFDKQNVSAFIGGIKQFNDHNLNGFKPYDISKTYASHLFKEFRLRYRQRKILKRYRDRDWTGKTFILSTEELASVYHLPDMSVVAPSIVRVEARRGSAPGNLPI